MESVGAIVFLPRDESGVSLMLEDLLFDPAAVWLSQALSAAGVDRFFVVCPEEDREPAASCFPPGTTFVTTGTRDAIEKLTAFLHLLEDRVIVITKPVQLSFEAARHLLSKSPAGPIDNKETGVCRVNAATLESALESGADFEAALQEKADPMCSRSIWFQEAVPIRPGWNGRMQAEMTARLYGALRLMESGVRIMDPSTTYAGPQVQAGEGAVLLPGSILRGKTVLGAGCEIGPYTMIQDCIIGDHVTVNASQLNESTVEAGTKIGPFAYIRPNCHVGRKVKVGDFVELKNSTIGDGTKISHLTYVGDSDVGGGVNFGCGTVTVNYDGTTKYRTVIGDRAFIGCNTNLVAPVRVGDGAYTAAGSTITNDVPNDSLAIARSIQVNKKQWAAKRRSRKR